MFVAAFPCRFQRPPGAIPSSMLGLEAYTGSLDHIGFEDYLNGNNIISRLFIFLSTLFTYRSFQVLPDRIIYTKVFVK